MSFTNKILLFLLGFVVLGAIGFIIYKEHEMSLRQIAIEKEIVAQKELSNNVLRAMSQYATKEDIDKFAKKANINMDEIKKDLSSLNANVVAINQLTASSQGQYTTGGNSTGTTPRTDPTPTDPSNPDPYGYQKNRQYLELSEKFENINIPIGQVGFSAWQDKPWDYTLHSRNYIITNVIGTDENQRHYVYNKFSVKIGDKSYDLKINSSQTLEEYPAAKFSVWNPRLYLGIDGGINFSSFRGEVSPTLSLGIMSYGKYKSQPDISIMQIGTGYGIDEKKLDFSLSPFSYNFGKHVPLTNNLYVGPSVHVNLNGNVSIMGSIKVGL